MSWTNVTEWIELNKSAFKPPVCNKLLHNDNVLSVFFVGGPNEREDYHVEEGEELFYQLKGDMILKVREQNKFKDIRIREGEVFLLPGRTPHSPQRFKDTIGLVVERRRLMDVEFDCLRYYAKPGEDPTVIFERWFYVTDLGVQLAPVIKEFMESEQKRTRVPGPNSRLCHPYFEDDTSRQLEDPKNLMDFISDNAHTLGAPGGSVFLFSPSKYKFHVEVLGNGRHSRQIPQNAEGFLYQISGKSHCKHSKGECKLTEQNTVLLSNGSSCDITNENGARTLFTVACMPKSPAPLTSSSR